MMGWLFHDRIPANPEAEIRRICTAQDNTRTMTPVAIARVGMTWYAAVRVTFASAEAAEASGIARSFALAPDHSCTFGAVFLTEISGGWGYKDIDETMGPVESHALAAILDLLSPTKDQWALDWRERCRGTAQAPQMLPSTVAIPERDAKASRSQTSFPIRAARDYRA